MTQHTILVVDDDADLRTSVCDALNDEGYRAIPAPDGRDALDRLRSETPCVIVLDLMMPVMNGWEFREAQRLDPAIAGIPVVVVTAMGSVDRAKIDANDVLLKPVRLDALLDTVAKYCNAA